MLRRTSVVAIAGAVCLAGAALSLAGCSLIAAPSHPAPDRACTRAPAIIDLAFAVILGTSSLLGAIGCVEDCEHASVERGTDAAALVVAGGTLAVSAAFGLSRYWECTIPSPR